jgi:hypothetical protein
MPRGSPASIRRARRAADHLVGVRALAGPAMALHMVTDRAFRTPAELSALVTAIVAADASTQETHRVEWRGPLPIGKADGQFAIASFPVTG